MTEEPSETDIFFTKDYEKLENDELFSIIYYCQKELLRRKIHTKFEDLRLK